MVDLGYGSLPDGAQKRLMRTKFVIICFAVTLAILSGILWLRSPKRSNGDTSGEAIPQTSVATNNSSVVSSTNQTLGKSELANSRISKMEQLVNERNVSVQFYGMVIDQDSNALAGVHVLLVLRHNAYGAINSAEATQFGALSADAQDKVLYPKMEAVSDGNGRFQWVDQEVTGDILGVKSLNKDGYEPEPGQYSCRAGGGDFMNPVLFKMWSTNIHEKLIRGNKSFDIVPDGKAYFINLTDGTINQTGQGDLKVRIKYTDQPVRGQIYDWLASIDVVNGGLLEEGLGTPMFEAPTDGYVPAFKLNGKIKGGQRGDTGERQFYLKLNGGQIFGQMTIGLYAPFNDQTPGLVRLSYAINPSGSRILR